jgi:hypothetical protein
MRGCTTLVDHRTPSQVDHPNPRWQRRHSVDKRWQDDQVPDGDLLREATEELYSSALEDFTSRRSALAAQARAAGDGPAAKRIAALRKPTRSAWVLNQLVRAAPGTGVELTGLGAELRTAQRSLDGAAIRDLSARRRRLIDDLVRQAFQISGQRKPPASLVDEVAATLAAALADPQIAAQLTAGTMERAARSDGFGDLGSPDVTGAIPLASSRPPPARTRTATPANAAAKAAEEAARARSEREQRRQAIAAAQREQAAADQAVGAAASAEQEQEDAVRRAEEQLAAARSDLAAAKLRTRSAITRQRRVRQTLDRLQK